MSVNRVLLTGRLTADPDLKVGGESKSAVCNMRLAVSRRRTNGHDRGAVFVDVAAFDRQAESCARFLRKGSRVAVDGRLEHSEWTTEAGEKRAKHEIVAQEVEFLDPNPGVESQTDDQQPRSVELAAVAP